MILDRLTRDLYAEICRIPLIDPHSHIDPRRSAARNLDDLLGYHYYTELAHSAGMSKELLGDVPPHPQPLSPPGARGDLHVSPRERVRAILEHMDRFDNTVQHSWFQEIARTFLGFRGERVTDQDCDALFDAAERVFGQANWEEQVLKKSNVEKIFLTNDFDEPLEGFDTKRYVPCLRTDDLVFHLDKPATRERLAKATGIDATDCARLRQAVGKLFEHFANKNAKACAISLPPNFVPHPVEDEALSACLSKLHEQQDDGASKAQCSAGVFWMLAEFCRDCRLPFDLMIGVNRRVYRDGVHQGQDLFDQRTSLIQYAELFNAFPEVTFPISVLTSVQNQELVSYSWIFPNVVTNGHWWYSNIPDFIERDARARLQAVPKTKQIGYYSDAYKLEFILPKYNMYRRILAKILADDFVRPGVFAERQALELGRLLLRENAMRVFSVE
ncbi:MAG: glucuronate isomerase [Gemmataceae bacterium]|nr:glucuronate isomerase [Gemmataceae bacterium]MCI0743462.1 glucuronate isomerase [Gemmataceae bacterium]